MSIPHYSNLGAQPMQYVTFIHPTSSNLFSAVPEPELSSSPSCDPQTSTHLPPPPAPHWTTVSLLLSLLRGQLERARGDLLSASVQAPMYGVMQSVRTALEEVQET